MDDLGKYAGVVLQAYSVTLALLALLIAISLIRARAAKRRLAALEEKRKP